MLQVIRVEGCRFPDAGCRDGKFCGRWRCLGYWLKVTGYENGCQFPDAGCRDEKTEGVGDVWINGYKTVAGFQLPVWLCWLKVSCCRL
jgi:hypothetical protein